jgi:hypothetical protein
MSAVVTSLLPLPLQLTHLNLLMAPLETGATTPARGRSYSALQVCLAFRCS